MPTPCSCPHHGHDHDCDQEPVCPRCGEVTIDTAAHRCPHIITSRRPEGKPE